MPRKAYDWALGSPPPRIEAHSLAKHEVLHRYLVTYVEVLTANPRVEHLRLTLVDGFAGGGVYHDEHACVRSGSPLLMLSAMNEAKALAQAKRTKPFDLDAHFVFIESSKAVAGYLETTLRERGHVPNLPDGRLRVIHGAFIEQVDALLASISARARSGRAIFLLDQYGYADVPLADLRRIFAELPHAEVILTFATGWLLDYMTDSAEFRATLARTGLTSTLHNLPSLLDAKQDSGWRRLAQSVLHADLHHGSGARFFTPFFIHSEAAGRDYWLVHLSNHARARDEMTKLHWALENRFRHYGKHGLDMLGYEPSGDPLVTGQAEFAFDSSARLSTHAALLEDIPHYLERLATDVPFKELFRGICNDTPASSTMLAEVVADLASSRSIELISSTGKVRRAGVKPAQEDRLRLPRQLWLDLVGGGRH